MNRPLISIIIVNYNGRHLLNDCLNSIYKNNYDNFEIILVDNNSVDESAEFVKVNFPTIRIIQLEQNLGFAEPNNLASKKALGSLLLFLNNDTKVQPNFLEELVKVVEGNPDIGICQSMLLKPNGEVDSSGDFIDNLGVSYSSKIRSDKISEILSAKGAAMLVRKKVFDKLGGFDEKFFISFEDVDLGWRSWILGFKVVVVPNSIVYHIGGQTIDKIPEILSFHGFKNQICMKITNFETIRGIKSLLKFFVIYGIRSIHVYFDYKTKGETKIQATNYEEKIAQKPKFSIMLKGFFWLLKNSCYLWRKHRFLTSNRVYTTKDLEQKKIIRSTII